MIWLLFIATLFTQDNVLIVTPPYNATNCSSTLLVNNQGSLFTNCTINELNVSELNVTQTNTTHLRMTQTQCDQTTVLINNTWTLVQLESTCNASYSFTNSTMNFTSTAPSCQCKLLYQNGPFLDQVSFTHTTCYQCPSGTFSYQGICSPCPTGTFSTAGSSACYNCPPGTANPLIGQSRCESCALGNYTSDWGHQECVRCTAGTYADVGYSSTCLSCNPGRASSEGSSSCSLCNLGTFSVTSETCDPCVIGKYVDVPGSSSCWNCASGKFSNVTGSTICTNCPLNTYSTLTQCIDCPIGKKSCNGIVCEEYGPLPMGAYVQNHILLIVYPVSISITTFNISKYRTSCQDLHDYTIWSNNTIVEFYGNFSTECNVSIEQSAFVSTIGEMSQTVTNLQIVSADTRIECVYEYNDTHRELVLPAYTVFIDSTCPLIFDSTCNQTELYVNVYTSFNQSVVLSVNNRICNDNHDYTLLVCFLLTFFCMFSLLLLCRQKHRHYYIPLNRTRY
jgi:hypothetical protein